MKTKELDNLLVQGNLNFLPVTFLDGKESRVLSRVSSLTRYWPDEELYPSLLLSLLRLPKQFKKIRSIAHLSRLICAEYFYKNRVIQAVDRFPYKRHLYLKLLKSRLEFPFGSKGVLGMVVAFNLLKHYEAFEEQHILEAVCRIVPNIHVVKGSLTDNYDKYNQVHTVYFEIEREECSEFSLDEVHRLEKELVDELKGCIEQLIPKTFMRRNEEEVYRNILSLRDELRSKRDIPQATITFEEQTQFDLFFTVVLLRLVKSHDPTIHELIEQQCPDTILIPDRLDYVGSIGEEHQKEASVFRVQIAKSAFFRKDRSVNLYKARRQVVSILTDALGALRDYNGGLILKQNERLEDFISLMSKAQDAFFLENFFDSITPIAMQSILPSTIVKEWCIAFLNLLDADLDLGDTHRILCRPIEDASIVVIRAEERSFKAGLLRSIKELGIPSLELGFAEVNRDGAVCFGLLYRPSLIDTGIDFCQIVRSCLQKWSEKIGKDQTLRLAVHASEPSLDPRINQGDQSYIMIKMLFEGLTRMGPDGKPHLAIAKSYQVSPDFKTYTFSLRESKWSNGMLITAHDFEYSWKNALSPEANVLFSDTFFLIKHARLAKEGKISLDEVGIKAIDEKTLRVELEYFTPYFLEVTAHWTYSLINRSIDKKYPGWAYQAGDNYVCNGPFKLVSWKHNRVITVEKNPYYWDVESVRLHRISINTLERDNIDSKQEGDIMGRPMTFFPTSFNRSFEHMEQESFPLNGVFVLNFNTTQFPFNHQKIRQAFAYAIDREKMQDIIPHEFDKQSYTLLPEELSLNKSGVFPKKDIEKARALFLEGLGEIGFVKSDFPKVTLSYYAGGARGKLFEEIVRQWQEVFEIPLSLKGEDWPTHFSDLLNGNYQIGGIEFNARWNDPLHLLECFENGSDSSNIPCFEDATYRELLLQAKQKQSMKERNHNLKKAEAFLGIHMPAIPLYQLSGRYIKRREVKGVYPSSCFQMDFKWTYKE